MRLCRPNLQVSGQMVFRQTGLRIQQINAFFIKFNSQVITKNVELINFLMSPNKENIISVSKPINLDSRVSRNLVSISFLKMRAYVGADFTVTLSLNSN